jgi:hypothetical protein
MRAGTSAAPRLQLSFANYYPNTCPLQLADPLQPSLAFLITLNGSWNVLWLSYKSLSILHNILERDKVKILQDLLLLF